MKSYRIAGILFFITLLAASCGQVEQLADAATPTAATVAVDRTPSTPVPASINVTCATNSIGQSTNVELIYHDIIVDEQGKILPWHDPGNLCASYDHVIHLVFEWWLTMQRNPGEPDLPYYLMHMTWEPPSPYFDAKGLGGDQLAMAMSSWRLLYAYTGDPRTIANMVLLADHVINNGLSPSDHP